MLAPRPSMVQRGRSSPPQQMIGGGTRHAQDIERVHETATGWKDFDPAAQEAADRIRREVQGRYGIDVNKPGADEKSVSDALAQAERDRAEADRQRSAGNNDGIEAGIVMGATGREDRNRAAEVESENAAAKEAAPH